jgi:endonuclease/exonuclease/phosphatase family metal-dependent hydrolase
LPAAIHKSSRRQAARRVHPAMLRVVVWNVQRFWGSDNKSSLVAGVCGELRRLRPQVVVLNEVEARPGLLDAVREAVGGDVVFFGHAMGGRYGNLVAAQRPLVVTEVHKVHLAGGSHLELPPGSGRLHRVARGLVVCEVSGPGLAQPFCVAATHLDHVCGEQRRDQMRHALDELAGLGRPLLLCGDLNALSRADYSDEHWAGLERRHAARGWAAPRDDDCLHMLRDRGFLDAFLHGRRAEQPHLYTAHVGEPIYRIDYCWADALFLRSFAVRGAWVNVDAAHSDHYPLIAEFEPQPLRARA